MRNNKFEKYSVLMSVYWKEKAEFLQESMESMYHQTVFPDEFILVCDGKLTEELYAVIDQMKERFGDVLRVLYFKENGGLGNALKKGLDVCRNDLIARMDSDDVSCPDRCERQLRVFQSQKAVSIVSGTVLEFQDTITQISGSRELPVSQKEILAFSRKRNPFNHPAVMFRKSAVEAAGGYREKYPLFEDYDLWIRMLQRGFAGYNLKEPLLYMRTPADLYRRRGGFAYAKSMLSFHLWLRRSGWTSTRDFVTGALPHAGVCILPVFFRAWVYKLLRA